MIHVDFDSSDKLNGLFNFFNKFSFNRFEISGSTYDIDSYVRDPSFVALRNQSSSLYWVSKIGDDSIYFHFQYLICLKHYTIVTAGDEKIQHSYPKEFKLFGSNNNNSWNILDHQPIQSFCTETTCPGVTKDYSITNNNFYRYFKITNIKNSADQEYLILRSVEFFGLINPFSRLTCKSSRKRFNYCFFLIVLC